MAIFSLGLVPRCSDSEEFFEQMQIQNNSHCLSKALRKLWGDILTASCLILALTLLSLGVHHSLGTKDMTGCGPGALGTQKVEDTHRHADTHAHTCTHTHTHTYAHLPPLERMVYQEAKPTSSLNVYYIHTKHGVRDFTFLHT